jgi:hypothetical protein
VDSVAIRAVVLALVAIGITAAVYGAVALIVKADDIGVALAKNDGTSAIDGVGRILGRALVRGMPPFLTFLSAVGTAAIIWVGGGIILHGLEVYGTPAIGLPVKAAAEAAAHAFPSAAGVLEWIVEATVSGAVGSINPDNWIGLFTRMEAGDEFSASRPEKALDLSANPAAQRPRRGLHVG